MPKVLIIAEKPSVATDLARVLGKLPEFGKFEKKKDYFENENAFISSAIGHLVELMKPVTAEGKKLPWNIKHLPVLPERFALQPIERSESRYKLLVRLMKKKEVDTIVNACDAGREGELIFQYVLQLADLKKDLTVKRMWMQSMTDGSIIDAWKNLRGGEEMSDLADAAMCRSESDWLIGLNGTRALTAFNSRNGGFNKTPAGRVQTPTLSILVERERLIRSFVPKSYWEVHGEFQVAAGQYRGRWFREDFKKDENDEHKKAERLWSAEDAEAIKARCDGAEGIVEETKKPSKNAPSLLFDLTTLQREGNSKHGFPARRTLQLAQACYDKYKILTYPRTDSKYLPEDYIDTVKETIATLATGKAVTKAGHPLTADLKKCCKWILDNNRIGPTKRIFNSAKVSDHFAIIPTGKLPPASIDEAAAKIYALVLKRFLAIFYPHAEYELTKRITRVGDDAFKTDGKVLIVPGYLEVYGRKAGIAAEADELVAAKDGETATDTETEVLAKETRPPARYTDATLLSAMETAGKRVEDDELRDAMSERGLGTPATRASVIEKLIREEFLFRNEIRKSELVASNKAIALMDLLDKIGVEVLASPEMTGEWEYKLKAMEQGKFDRATFMKEIRDMTCTIVDQTKTFTEEIVNRKFDDLKVKCPECGTEDLRQTDGLFQCKDAECLFELRKHIASHEITEAEARDLINNRRIGPIEDFLSRYGQPFAAELTLEKPEKPPTKSGKPRKKTKKDWKVSFVFEGDEERESEIDNLTEEQIICECPILDGSTEMIKVYENARAFLAPGMANKKDDRGVRISKTILKKEIPTEQGRKLFMEGKTDLMPGFISKKGRPFAAHLKLNRETGKLEFEFAPRKSKKKKAKKGEEGTNDAAPKKKAAKKKAKKKTAKKKTTRKKTTTKKPKKEEA